ncbi:FAD-dependent oxidoreductase [Muricomes intestini]|jgi:hypothetical protein|uniref:FAD-dependent oxidoreductase n=1 Tax=Muricomes intestini TaxID=1796634 RepID=UPI002FE4141A
MKKIEIFEQATIVGNYDVVVCGGGPAGFIAAIAAARGGASVAIVEQYGFLGGMATAGLVAPISRFNLKGRRMIGGIPWEFIERLKEMGGAIVENPPGNISFMPEKYKLIAQRLVLEAGVDLYFHCYLTGCLKKDNEITHIIFHTKEGMQSITGRYFIDCTGDADLAWYADVPMQPKSNPLQPASLCFCLGGVDTAKLPLAHHNLDTTNMHDVSIQNVLNELREKEGIPLFGGPWYSSMIEEGYLAVNMTRFSGDMTKVTDMTNAECTLHEDVFRMVELLKGHVDAFKNAFLVTTAPQVGIRETRRIKGAYILTGQDYVEGRRFPDAISRGCHPIDIHHADNTRQNVTFLEKSPYIPYRTLYVPAYPNLLVPGRCFSADETASASVRVQASVMGLGQAAGTSAALCVKDNCSVDDVNVESLREKLISMGAILD